MLCCVMLRYAVCVVFSTVANVIADKLLLLWANTTLNVKATSALNTKLY